MIKSQFGKVLRPFVMFFILLTVGCAQQMQSVQPDAAPEAMVDAQIKSITVADDASSIDIISDKPIVYTYYMLDTPPRVVVDLAQTTSGTLVLPMEVNRGNVKRIDVAKHAFGSGVLSRVEVLLAGKVEVSAALDLQDKNRLILKLAAPPAQAEAPPRAAEPTAVQPATASVPEEVKVADPAPVSGENKPVVSGDSPVVVTEKPAPAAMPVVLAKGSLKKGERGLTAIVKNEDSIELEVTGGVDSFKVFKLDQPERLVIDIPRVKSALTDKTVDINGFNLGKARIGASPEKLRIVFDAVGAAIPNYTVTRSSAGLLLAFGQRQKPEVVPQQQQQQKQDLDKPRSGSGTVEAVEFSQADGFSRITIKTSGNCNARQPVKTGKGYSLALKDCLLPANQQRQLDTKGFATAIRSIAPFSVKGKSPETRIAVNLRGTLSNTLKTEGNTLQWDFSEPSAKAPKADSVATSPAGVLAKEISEPKPAENKAEKAMEEGFAIKAPQAVSGQGKVYSGRKVTLEFSDADIKKIFQLLAEVSNQNFLISDDVSGTISLKLVNVPWDQALDVILENKNLGMQRDGNIVQIRPKNKMKSLDDEALEMQAVEEKKLPLATVIFDVNFATIGDIENQFKAFKRLRNDWSVTSDTRTNKIIVVDTERNIKRMRALLESLDVPEKQVMIEARIVQADSNFARDIGVRWNFGYQDGSASVANINAITGAMGGVVTTGLTGTTGGAVAGVSFGKLLSNIQLDMRLSAAATIGQLKIISTPKVMTVNNKPAKISQGQMIPYQNTTSTDGAKTEFIEAALSLEVTPHITADGSVSMKIKASNNSVGSGTPPAINKKEATTELVVKNGETTVIGGIYEDREVDTETGMPYLSEIPLLGWLFKSNTKSKTKNELLIFITPKIMS